MNANPKSLLAAPEIQWADVRAGDEISLLVMDWQHGHVRERRTVLAVKWPMIALAEGGRCYEIDAEARDRFGNRAIRLERRDA